MGIFSRVTFFSFVTLRIWKYKLLSNCASVSGHPKCYHPLLTSGKGMITFGDNVQIGVISSPNFYSHYAYLEARFENSTLFIGNDVVLNNAFSAVAFSKIVIGDGTLIGFNCSIIDNDGHHLNPQKRNSEEGAVSEVIIKKNVFIGNNVTILKGVTIGENSVIGNGAIVTKNVPDNTVFAGNPAKEIRSL